MQQHHTEETGGTGLPQDVRQLFALLVPNRTTRGKRHSWDRSVNANQRNRAAAAQVWDVDATTVAAEISAPTAHGLGKVGRRVTIMITRNDRHGGIGTQRVQ